MEGKVAYFKVSEVECHMYGRPEEDEDISKFGYFYSKDHQIPTRALLVSGTEVQNYLYS